MVTILHCRLLLLLLSIIAEGLLLLLERTGSSSKSAIIEAPDVAVLLRMLRLRLMATIAVAVQVRWLPAALGKAGIASKRRRNRAKSCTSCSYASILLILRSPTQAAAAACSTLPGWSPAEIVVERIAAVRAAVAVRGIESSCETVAVLLAGAAWPVHPVFARSSWSRGNSNYRMFRRPGW